MTAPILVSTLTCPACRFAEALAMPTDSCVFFHKCAGCGTLLRPKPGDCCVFCSFGSVRCPMEQKVGNKEPTQIELIQNAKKLLAERYGVPPEVIMLGSTMGEERDRARRHQSDASAGDGLSGRQDPG